MQMQNPDVSTACQDLKTALINAEEKNKTMVAEITAMTRQLRERSYDVSTVIEELLAYVSIVANEHTPRQVILTQGRELYDHWRNYR